MTPVKSSIPALVPNTLSHAARPFVKVPRELCSKSATKIDYRVIGDDGKERWIQTQSIIEPAKTDQFKNNLSISIDITEQKGSEERIRQLMYEVNHRAKNLLTVVQAVARQTAKVGNPDTFLKRLSARIAGLAASQDLLVLTQWNGIQIADLVQAQLQGFSDQLGTRITVDGPKLKLKSHATQAIGMAVHELATNASKYGALSNETGTVMISWKLSGEAQNLFCMTWRENGGPEVTQPTSQGFGQTVIVQLVQASLNGRAEIQYLPAGLVWNVEAPVTSILE